MLTGKQARFVEEYLIDLNATQAAIRAGYSERTAYKIGDENLRKPQIAAALAKAQKERSERTKLDADWVLRRLGDEAEADLADIYEEDGRLKPVHKWPMIWRKGLVAGVEVEEEKIEGVITGYVRKVKLSDRIRRVELIGKHVAVQAFRDQVGHAGPDGGAIKTEEVSDNTAIARRLAFLLAKGTEG